MPDLLAYDRKGLAAALSISVTTLDRWVCEGVLPPPTISRGAKIRLWSRAVIEEWLASQSKSQPAMKLTG